jgi:hypothetical protein
MVKAWLDKSITWQSVLNQYHNWECKGSFLNSVASNVCALFSAEETIQSLIEIRCYGWNQRTSQGTLQTAIPGLLCKHLHIKSQRKQVEMFNIKANTEICTERIGERTLNQQTKQQKHQSPPPSSEVRLIICESVHGHDNRLRTIRDHLTYRSEQRTTVRNVMLWESGLSL